MRQDFILDELLQTSKLQVYLHSNIDLYLQEISLKSFIIYFSDNFIFMLSSTNELFSFLEYDIELNYENKLIHAQ